MNGLNYEKIKGHTPVSSKSATHAKNINHNLHTDDETKIMNSQSRSNTNSRMPALPQNIKGGTGGNGISHINMHQNIIGGNKR